MRTNLKSLLFVLVLLGAVPFMGMGVFGYDGPTRSEEGIVPNPGWMGIPSIQEDSVPFAVAMACFISVVLPVPGAPLRRYACFVKMLVSCISAKA